MAAKLQQLEKQRGEVERTRDELKVCWPVGCMGWAAAEGVVAGKMLQRAEWWHV
jgi:hypothetical protein